MPDFRSLPKIELHVHLEGTIDASTALALAEHHGVHPSSLPLQAGAYPSPFRGFEHFVETFLAVSALVRDPDDLATVAAAFARDRVEQNVIYTEVTFTAGTLVRNGWDPKTVWEAVRAGFAESGPDHEIHLIVDTIRNMGAEEGPRTIALVEGADAPIVGLGLTGVEGSVHEREFRTLRDAADRLGLGLAVHAGEAGDPGRVRAALDDLGADRIGHGVASVLDAGLVERVVRDEVPVEVCPTSNVSLGFYPSAEDHPFSEMWRAGMNVTVNSDDPPFFGTSLTDELGIAQRIAGLSSDDVIELQRRGARAAFASPETRDRLLARIDAWTG